MQRCSAANSHASLSTVFLSFVCKISCETLHPCLHHWFHFWSFFSGSAKQHDPPGAHQVSASGVAVVWDVVWRQLQEECQDDRPGNKSSCVDGRNRSAVLRLPHTAPTVRGRQRESVVNSCFVPVGGFLADSSCRIGSERSCYIRESGFKKRCLSITLVCISVERDLAPAQHLWACWSPAVVFTMWTVLLFRPTAVEKTRHGSRSLLQLGHCRLFVFGYAFTERSEGVF